MSFVGYSAAQGGLPAVLTIDGPFHLFNDPPPIAFDRQVALMAVNVTVAESRSSTLVVFQVNGIENMDGPPSFFVAVEPDGQPVRKAGEPLFVAEPGDQLQVMIGGVGTGAAGLRVDFEWL